MFDITHDKTGYFIDGEPAFLVSGEFHYFRVPKADWRRRLRLFKEAGGNCVATYIPWALHEPEEGTILFGDRPERDLEGFLRACADVGISVLCRPGPYQYSELRCDGLPSWLCEYSELRARDVSGKDFRFSSISYLHPLFLEKAMKWYDAVCPILARHTSDRGGPISLVQFDNELMGIHLWMSGMDYNAETIGLGREDGRYAVFLRRRYGDSIKKLNEAYHTDFASFGAVVPHPEHPSGGMGPMRRVKDYQDFYLGMTAEYSRLLADRIRAHGIGCPLVHNAANPNMNHLFAETVGAFGDDFLLGSDHYYNLGMDWPQNNPTPQYASRVLFSNELLRSWSFPPTVFELPGGSCSEWPPITPVDLKSCYYANLAFGMKGLNYYIFTGGPNPEGLGENSDSYDYGAPIAADGTLRESYDTLKEFGLFMRDNPWLSRAERVCDVTVGLVNEYARSDRYDGARSEDFYPGSAASAFSQKGLLTTLLCSSYSPEIADLRVADFAGFSGKPLLVPSASFMPREIQEKLVAFVKAGGRLLLGPAIPGLDENLSPCTLLADFLGVWPTSSLRARTTMRAGGVRPVLCSSFFATEALPEGAEILGEEESTDKPVAWIRRFEGDGAVLFLGAEWTYSKYEHNGMLEALLGVLSPVSRAVSCDNPNVWAALRSDGEKDCLFLLNLFTSPMKARVRAGGRDLGELTVDAMTVRVLPL